MYVSLICDVQHININTKGVFDRNLQSVNPGMQLGTLSTFSFSR